MATTDPSASVAATAVVTGDVTIGPGSRVLHGAVLNGDLGPMFPGSRAGRGCELRINSVLHVNSELPPGTVVPIGWIAAGRPAELFSPDRHDDLWAVQQRLDFPGTVYGVPRGTSMRDIMRQQSERYAPLRGEGQ